MATGSENPPLEVMRSVYGAAEPALTVTVFPPTVDGPAQKSVAVPLRATVCGLVVVLSVRIKSAVFAPVVEPHCAPGKGAAGLKLTCILQVAPGRMPVQSLFGGAKSAVSLMLALLTVKAAVPVLVSVTATDEPATPTS